MGGGAGEVSGFSLLSQRVDTKCYQSWWTFASTGHSLLSQSMVTQSYRNKWKLFPVSEVGRISLLRWKDVEISEKLIAFRSCKNWNINAESLFKGKYNNNVAILEEVLFSAGMRCICHENASGWLTCTILCTNDPSGWDIPFPLCSKFCNSGVFFIFFTAIYQRLSIWLKFSFTEAI